MPMTLEQAKRLQHRDILHHDVNKNVDGTCQRWRVNGKVKTWKRHPDRVQVPLKYGMWGYDYLTEGRLDCMHLESECPMNQLNLKLKSK